MSFFELRICRNNSVRHILRYVSQHSSFLPKTEFYLHKKGAVNGNTVKSVLLKVKRVIRVNIFLFNLAFLLLNVKI